MSARRKVRVYGGNHCGTHRAILATTSITAFAAATGISRSYIDGETDNKEECRVALAEPGTIFYQSYRGHDAPWMREPEGRLSQRRPGGIR